jgi:hypothetical protein
MVVDIYSSTLSSTSALDAVGGQRNAPEFGGNNKKSKIGLFGIPARGNDSYIMLLPTAVNVLNNTISL